MHNIDWEHLKYFLEVVRAGSVSQAAQRLQVNQTTVSRRISSLEKSLGKHLFERSVNGWLITALGERLIASTEQMAEEAYAIERYAIAESQELSGKLRVTIGDICTQQLMMPAVQSFTEKYPDVELEIVATRDDLNLSMREADIALRATDQPPQNLVGKRITELTYAVYGNKKFLNEYNNNKDKSDMPCITWLGDGQTIPTWIEKSLPEVKRIYRTSELGMMLNMTKQGIGVAQLPCALADVESDLYRIPVPYIEAGWGLWVLSHVDVRTNARVRIFKNILIDELQKKINLIEGKWGD